ncbi:sodium:proton antiporter [uncultured Massilia sp.]|uniref:cation:proton antiporter n=1 Tax=uncultured Massilia sp. TaxID=169973 RepID=UPI00258489C8|nr:sodium:proton antiporter [uncultured Massilia sp.]
MTSTHWILFGGATLIVMMLGGTLVTRLPLSGAMIYLGVGVLLGPAVANVFASDPLRFAPALELVAEAALLISLFSVGLKLEIPLRDQRWLAPLRLAFVSMAITVVLIAAIGVLLLDLPLGAAILLGGILAPTDPVLASGIQPEAGDTPDLVRFNLAGEGGLNDGSAFPVVVLGLGLMGSHDDGTGVAHWLSLDLAWSLVGGILIGAATSFLIGTAVVFLRNRHDEALGMNEFLSLGIVAVCFGLAELCHASGFLAVFAAGIALQRVYRRRDISYLWMWKRGSTRPERETSAAMKEDVQGFNEQIEKLAEPVLVILTGAMLAYVTTFPSLWWFTALSLFVVRPLAVFLGMAGSAMPARHHAMVGWFGIRGIGSVYYLMYALDHGLSGDLAQRFVAFTLVAVTASILLHGVTAGPLMASYAKGETGQGEPRKAPE